MNYAFSGRSPDAVETPCDLEAVLPSRGYLDKRGEQFHLDEMGVGVQSAEPIERLGKWKLQPELHRAPADRIRTDAENRGRKNGRDLAESTVTSRAVVDR